MAVDARSRRNLFIAGSVVLFHAAALWALQTGLIRRAIEVVVPVEVLSEIITPPAPKVEPVPEPQPLPVQRDQIVKKSAPAPQPIARPDPAPSPGAPTGMVEPQPAPAPIAAPVAAAPAPRAPVQVQLPSSDADYLQNPKPAYPPMSKRLGEQGQVLIRALIGADGAIQQLELRQSSGYERLDQAALTAVRKWRFVPGKRAGEPEAMWHQIPINFVLE